jgi:NADH-quinone oxidoreductase subunit N
MTIAMLGLAGIPATAGFIGKFNLIGAAVRGNYTWLGVFIVVGSMISLAYYLRIIAAMWMGPAPARATAPVMAGGAVDEGAAAALPPGPRAAGFEVYLVAVVAGAASLVFGIVPGPLFDLAQDAARSFAGLL